MMSVYWSTHATTRMTASIKKKSNELDHYNLHRVVCECFKVAHSGYKAGVMLAAGACAPISLNIGDSFVRKETFKSTSSCFHE